MESSLAITGGEESREWKGRGCGERRKREETGERWGDRWRERKRRERLEMGAE